MQIQFEFRGLCCAAPASDGKSLDVVLVQTLDEQHDARLVVPTECVDYGQKADGVVSVPGGATYYIWTLQDRKVGLKGKETASSVKLTDKNLGNVEKPRWLRREASDIRWIPSIEDLAGAPFDDKHRSPSTVAGSVIHLPGGGQLASALDDDQTQVWEFRVNPDVVKDRQVIAERIIYELDVAGDSIELTGVGPDEKLLLKTPQDSDDLLLTISNLPRVNTRMGAHMHHFGRFYALLVGSPPGPKPSLPGNTTRGARPVQCGTARVRPLK